MSDIDLRLLRVFATVVESGGFAVATAKLNVAESTISQHMSDLERRMGLRLCERGRAGFRLTDTGEEAYAATVALLAELDGFRDRLAALSPTMAGRFPIGLPDAIATFEGGRIAAALGRFLIRAPALHPVVAVLSPRDLERQVMDGKLACAVAPEHRRVAGLEYRPLFAEPNLLYCGAGHPLFARPDADIAEADIDASARISRGYLERFDAHLFANDHYAATVTETEAAAILILSGAFMGFLPTHYAQQWVEAGRMRPLLPHRYAFSSQFHLIARRTSAVSPLVELFADCLARDLRAAP